MELDDEIGWRNSVSARPVPAAAPATAGLGGWTQGREPALRIAKGYAQRDWLTAMNGVRHSAPGIEAGRAVGLSSRRMAGGNLGRAAHSFAPALNSGPMTLKPFDVNCSSMSTTDGSPRKRGVHRPARCSGQLRLDNQRDLNRTLRRLRTIWPGRGLYQVLAKLERWTKRVEIGRITLSIQDRGMLARSIALQQRYSTHSDPTAGDAEGIQRQKHYSARWNVA